MLKYLEGNNVQNIKESLISYLEQNNLKYIERENKISHQCVNPSHQENSPSAFTVLEFGNEYNHCSSCNFHMNTESLYKFLELGFDEKVLFVNQIKNILKQSESKPNKESAQIFLPIKEAMFDKFYRGISSETFEKIGAYHTFKDSYYGRRIIIPIYNYRNELKSFEAISTSSKIQPKVLRPKNVLTADLLGFEHLLGESDTLFLCEGTFSALSFWELGYQGVFNMGVATIKDKIKTLHLKGIKNIILAADNDEVGRTFSKECYHLLKHNFNVAFFQFPYNSPEKYDSNDLLKKDREILQACINRTLSKGLIKIKYNKIQENKLKQGK